MYLKNIKKLLIIFLFNISALQSSDRFNTTFGSNSNGVVTTSIADNAQGFSHVIDATGNIFVVGNSTSLNTQSIILVKYLPDGTIDTSFGTDGIVTNTAGSLSNANDIILDGSNNIIISGSTVVNGINSLKLIKYDSSGNLLSSFTESLPSATVANSLSLDGSGNILISGAMIDEGQASGLICKFDSSLNLDPSFGTNGRLIVQSSANHTFFNSIKIDSAGRIIASGSSSNNDFLLFRCDGTGVPDSNFGTNGIVSTLLSDSKITSIILDGSDNIIAAGQSSSQVTLAKYSVTDGSLIEAFGTNGIVTTSIGTLSIANSVMLDSSNIVVTGMSDNQLIIVRYTSAGVADTTFTSDGILTATIGSDDVGNKILSQIDGNYIISGYSDTNIALVNVRKDLSPLVKISNLINLKTYNQSIIKIKGTSTATSVTQVDIYIDNVFFVSTNTDLSGNWDAGASSFLSDGVHTIFAQFNGSVLSRDKKTITVDTSIVTAAAFGNTLKVDSIYGDDLTAVRNGPPFKTITAALAKAQSGDVVWLNPGTYNETITIPNGVIVRGISPSTCTIQKVNVTSDTDLVTMGENCSLEHVKLNLTSSQHVQLRGVVFPGTSSATSKVLFSNIAVNNIAAGGAGTSNVYGIHSNGTGQSTAFNQAIVLSAVVVVSAGNGNKRALLVDGANKFNALNSIFFANNTGAGTAIGVETNNASAAVNINTTVIFGSPTADISQTSGSITLKGSILQNTNANLNQFINLESPKSYIFADSGAVNAGMAYYLRPGTAAASTTETKVRISQKTIVTGFAVNLNVAPGSGNSVTWTIRKNGVDTSMAITISDEATSGTYNSSTINFAAGDYISISQLASGANSASDVIAIVDYF